MWEILKKVKAIIEEERAVNNYNFFAKYSDYLVGTGARSVDYSLHRFDLSEQVINQIFSFIE